LRACAGPEGGGREPGRARFQALCAAAPGLRDSEEPLFCLLFVREYSEMSAPGLLDEHHTKSLRVWSPGRHNRCNPDAVTTDLLKYLARFKSPQLEEARGKMFLFYKDA